MFSIIPVTFAFDLSDASLKKDLTNFSRYFNFVDYSQKLLQKGTFNSQSDIDMSVLIKKSEQIIIAEQKKNHLSKIKNPEKVQNMKENQPCNISRKVGLINLRSCTSVELNAKRKLVGASTAKKPPQIIEEKRNNSLIEEHKSILQYIKLPFFNFSCEKFNLLKPKNDDLKKSIDYTKVRLNEHLSAGNNVWVFKVDGLNRGFGVEVFSSLEELKTLIDQTHAGYQENFLQENKKVTRSKAIIKTSKFIVQKYIERPFLFYGRKMDFRVWVLFSHDLKAYVFRECYVRLSSEKFTMANLQEKFVHLTNNALQKYSENYDENETLKDIYEFEDFVRKTRKDNYEFKKDTLPQIESIVKLLHNISVKNMNEGNKKIAFEIFGFDFMVDDSLKVWLIEVNTNPSITTPGYLLKKLVPRMIDDAFKITLDKIFPCPIVHKKDDAHFQRTYSVKNYEDEENLWDLICDQ